MRTGNADGGLLVARINLLPWRDELRRRREKNFFIAAGIAVALMAGVIYGIQVKLQQDIDYQNGRNTFLMDQTRLLDKKLKSIRDGREEAEYDRSDGDHYTISSVASRSSTSVR